MSTSWGDIPNWSYDAVVALLRTLKLVDPLTYAHCCRVGEMSRKLARDAGLNEYEQKVAEFSGILHDIGKIGISQEIIAKPGKLTDDEYEIMKSHSLLSENIIKPFSKNSFFADLLPAIRGHHERIDGRGYPDQKRGDEIPLIARIILIVDTCDAMSETRSYRKGLPTERVYDEVQKYSGTQFDSQLAKIFLNAHRHWQKEAIPEETYFELLKKVA